jgi:hypothetical protein
MYTRDTFVYVFLTRVYIDTSVRISAHVRAAKFSKFSAKIGRERVREVEVRH